MTTDIVLIEIKWLGKLYLFFWNDYFSADIGNDEAQTFDVPPLKELSSPQSQETVILTTSDFVKDETLNNLNITELIQLLLSIFQSVDKLYAIIFDLLESIYQVILI